MALIRTTYSLSELSLTENMALNYCLARLEPERFAQPFQVVWQFHVKEVGETTARQQMNEGLEGLAAKGLVEGIVRDGHRDWAVVGDKTRLRLDRITDGRTLVSGTVGGGIIVGEGE